MNILAMPLEVGFHGQLSAAVLHQIAYKFCWLLILKFLVSNMKLLSQEAH